MLASYRLTQYLLLYLVREALELDEAGRAFCANPRNFVEANNGRVRIRRCVGRLVKDMIIDLNAEVRERDAAGSPLDYKRELKSPNAVRDLSRSIVPQYQKLVSRGRADSFGQEWSKSEKGDPVDEA